MTDFAPLTLPDHLQHFTDREELLAEFDSLWDSDQSWILALAGMSGTGKSALINYIIETRCKPNYISYALLDFDNDRLRSSHRSVLEVLVHSPSVVTHIDTPQLNAYRRKVEQILGDRDRRTLEIHNVQSMSDAATASQSMHLNYADVVRAINRQSADRLAEAWLHCIERLGDGRFVVFMDTYEAIQDASQSDIAGWLWQDVLAGARTVVPNLRVVVGGRDPLQRGRGLRQALVRELSRQHSDELLSRLGVTDEGYRAAVYAQLAQGHPLLTEMAAEAWMEGGIASDVPRLANQARAVEWLHGRIIERLPQPMRDLVRWAATLRSFDAESLSEALGVPIDAEAFGQLRRMSFVSEATNGKWTCHKLVRGVLTAYLKRERPREYREHVARAVKGTDDEIDRLFYRLQLDADAAFGEWLRLARSVASLYDVATLSSLVELIIEVEDLLLPPSRAEAKFFQGLLHAWKSKYHEARTCYEDAQPIFRAIGNSLGEANCIRCLGDVHLSLAEYPEARASYRDAWSIFQGIGDRLGEAYCIRGLGNVHLRLCEYPAALASFEKAHPVFHAVGDRLGEANCIRSLGDLHMSLTEFPEARARYRAARLIFHAVRDKLGEAECIKSLGDLHLSQSEYPEARATFQEAQSIFHTIGNRLGEANCIKSLGDVSLRMAECPEARESYLEAQSIFHAVGDRLGEANCIKSLGDLHLTLAEYPEARASYQEAQPIFHAIGNRLGAANCIRCLGSLHLSLAEYPEARESYLEALSIFHAVGDRLGEANCIKGLGDVHHSLAEHPEAQASYHKAQPIFHAIGNRLGEADCIICLGDVQLSLAAYPEARASYLSALSIFQAIGDRLGESNCIKRLGNECLRQTGNS